MFNDGFRTINRVRMSFVCLFFFFSVTKEIKNR